MPQYCVRVQLYNQKQTIRNTKTRIIMIRHSLGKRATKRKLYT